MCQRPYKDAAFRGESSTGTTLIRYVRIAVLVAVLCGGVAWVLWRPSGAGDPARSPALSSRSTGSEAPSNAAGGKRTPRGEGKLPDVSPPPLSSHSTSLPQHSIAGWVLNEAGEPVPGIALVALARRLEQRPVQGAPAQRRHGHHTETDAAGFFRLLALADGEYDVRTVATKRYAVAHAVLRAGVQSAVLALKEGVEQEVYVYGIVESTAGKPLEGVRVRRHSARGRSTRRSPTRRATMDCR